MPTSLNRELLEHIASQFPALDVFVDLDDEELLAELCSVAVGSDLVERVLRAASEFVDDPHFARIKVNEYDVVFGLLDDVRDEIISNEDGALVDNYQAAIDGFLARFPDPADLWRWGASCIDANQGSKIDDDHDWWSAEVPGAEEYAEQQVRRLLGQ